jgi:hypothetical protein
MTRREMRINPSGRPLERPGFEATFAVGILAGWLAAVVLMFLVTGRGPAAGAAPAIGFALISAACWALAEHVAGRRALVWPGSALGIAGPVSLGYAVAYAAPELREAPFQLRLAVIATVAGVAMVPYVWRFRLPGLVSPIITFCLVGLFLGLYGTDMEKLREVEGFSPRGIVAALMTSPLIGAVFGVLGLAATVAARRLDFSPENFGLAAARPLHLIGAGVVALVAGRFLALLPQPLDIAGLALAWIAAAVWTMRVNRVAVMFACHLAMAKPLVRAIAEPLGVSLTLEGWTMLLAAILWFDLLIWPFLHLLSARIGLTLGPGGKAPPDRPGAFWRYWPYADAETLDRWEARKAERRAARARRASRGRRRGLSGGEDSPGTDTP